MLNLLFMSVILLGCVGPAPGEDHYRLQVKTVTAMRGVVELIDEYRTHHGRLPQSLDDLAFLREHPSYRHDGWNRTLYFYSTGKTYLLASFGRSGTPDPQSSAPGMAVLGQNFEDDIVLIDGVFAQTPFMINP